MPAFLSSISMILVSELGTFLEIALWPWIIICRYRALYAGDKTFFIAAIMAMRHNRVVIFVSAISALVVMTILSAVMGYALPNILPRRYTHYAATALFLFFGVRLLKDAFGMEGVTHSAFGWPLYNWNSVGSIGRNDRSWKRAWQEKKWRCLLRDGDGTPPKYGKFLITPVLNPGREE